MRPRERGGSPTGPNPVDRGKKGSKPHVLSEAQGIPPAVAVPGANVHDSQAFRPLLLGLPAIRSRRGPRRRRPVGVRTDKAHFSAAHLARLRSRGLVPRIARPGIEPGERLGRHRRKVERSIARLFGHRRLPVRVRDR
ncbi:transposase [Streptomyces sp. NPDC088915]|uniref:transposase n=1 Tax=Streptomyces sp. NPDC088915 TaxID=3365912 RepID=UPI00380950A2